MQWDKVKNVLISILLAVDIFLLGNLGIKITQAHIRTGKLEDDLRTLISAHGLTLATSFRLPEDKSLLPLALDRSRASEEKMAEAMLGIDVSRTEHDDGSVIFESPRGALEWSADGTVNGVCTIDEPPQSANRAKRLARSIVQDWGIADDTISYDTSGLTVTVSGTVARQKVHNRKLVLSFGEDGSLTVSGRWSFGTPYANARDNNVTCAAADALLSFAADAPAKLGVISMEAGYRMESDSSRRMQLTPTWKIETSAGEYLVDCAKKTIIEPET